MEKENTELVTQEQIHEIVAVTQEDSAITKIENGLSDYLQHVFLLAQEEDTFHKAIQMEVIKRLPELKNGELIALTTSNRTNLNDLISKIMSPTLQLATAKQQNEMTAKKETTNQTLNQTNIGKVSTEAGPEVLAGLQTLLNIINVTKVNEKTT